MDKPAANMVLVPREPTSEMIEAGRWPAEDDGPLACYKAMLAAAPQPARDTEISRWHSAYEIAHEQATQNGQALKAAEARLSEAAEVLKPFADFIEHRDKTDPDMPDDAPIVSFAASLREPAKAVTFGAFRAARKFLDTQGGGNG